MRKVRETTRTLILQYKATELLHRNVRPMMCYTEIVRPLSCYTFCKSWLPSSQICGCYVKKDRSRDDNLMCSQYVSGRISRISRGALEYERGVTVIVALGVTVVCLHSDSH